MLQIKDDIPVSNYPDKPKLKRKVRLAVDPKTIAKPPKTQPKPKPKNTSEQDATQPTVETDQPTSTPVAPPPRQTPYLWRNSAPGRNIDRQGRRWTRD